MTDTVWPQIVLAVTSKSTTVPFVPAQSTVILAGQLIVTQGPVDWPGAPTTPSKMNTAASKAATWSEA